MKATSKEVQNCVGLRDLGVRRAVKGMTKAGDVSMSFIRRTSHKQASTELPPPPSGYRLIAAGAGFSTPRRFTAAFNKSKRLNSTGRGLPPNKAFAMCTQDPMCTGVFVWCPGNGSGNVIAVGLLEAGKTTFTSVVSRSYIKVASLSPSRPSVIFTMLDDLGFADSDFKNGIPNCPTPVLTTIAKNGVIIQEHYTLQFCSPTRMAFLTGRQPWRHGHQGMNINKPTENGLPVRERSIADELKLQGPYFVLCIQAFHLYLIFFLNLLRLLNSHCW